MAEPTGVTTTSVEDDAELAGYADDEFGADVPSEYTTETAQDAPARAAARRPVVTGNAGGTGRRKEAIARVRILPGSGQWTINGRTLDVYFPNKVHQQLVNEPFVTLGAESQFDVVALISGGGVTGQAVRPTPRRDPRADPGGPGEPPGAEEGRSFLTRDARVKERKKYGLKKAGRRPSTPSGKRRSRRACRAHERSEMGEAGQRSRLFGTDGVRGVAGHELTAQLAMDLSVAAAEVLGRAASARDGRPVAVVGRDPRASGEFLEAAVVAGLASAGVDVLRLGVIPTPGVAYLTGALGAAFGVVISASHNPARDNGIKFFGPGGIKLPDATEDDIEAQLRTAQLRTAQLRTAAPIPDGAGFGRVSDAIADHERYLDHLMATLANYPQPPLAGLRIVADCAHGAAYRIAPEALRRAGAEVIAIGDEPDGLNINEGCGSTALGALAAAVVTHGADAGIAYDGDADRCLRSTRTGSRSTATRS